jgi:hypothetical protein
LEKKKQKNYVISQRYLSIKGDAKLEELKVDGNKIYINSEDYVEVTNRKTRDFLYIYLNILSGDLKKTKELRSIIYNLEIPKSESTRNEITRKYSTTDKEKIEKQVKQLEEEINQLVYKLYGLNEEEIRIISNSIRS